MVRPGGRHAGSHRETSHHENHRPCTEKTASGGGYRGCDAEPVCRTEASAEVLGFYAISLAELVNTDLPEQYRKRLPIRAPVFRRGRLATARQHQGKEIGEFLLFDAIDRVMRITQEVGGIGLVSTRNQPQSISTSVTVSSRWRITRSICSCRFSPARFFLHRESCVLKPRAPRGCSVHIPMFMMS